jgi:hypothetical protein
LEAAQAVNQLIGVGEEQGEWTIVCWCWRDSRLWSFGLVFIGAGRDVGSFVSPFGHFRSGCGCRVQGEKAVDEFTVVTSESKTPCTGTALDKALCHPRSARALPSHFS